MKIKAVAMISIVSVVFSAVSPVFADTSDNELAEREKRVTERVVNLYGREINLEDHEREFNHKKAELDELEKKLHNEKVEFSVREIENEDTRARLNWESELIAAQNQELLNDKAKFEGYRASVVKQGEEAERKMTEAEEKMKLAKASEEKAQQFQLQLDEQEIILANEWARLNSEMADFLVSRDKLSADFDNLAKREDALNIARNKVHLFSADVAKKYEEAKLTMSEAIAMKAEAEENKRKADAILERNNELENVVAKLSADLFAKTEELNKIYQNRVWILFAELPSDLPSNVSATETPRGIINWSDGSVRAKGEGVVPPNKTDAQGEILARRAAVVDLQRNLLETIQGVQLDSKTTVKDAMTTSDTITTAISGVIRGVEVVEEKFENGKYMVWGQIRQDQMSNAMNEIVKKVVKYSPKRPPEPKTKTGQFTGLIIDATGLAGLQPRKLVRIVDEKGRPVYGPEFADRNIQITKGLCAYFDMIVFKDNESERVGDNPLKIKAQRLSNENADIVIPNWAAEEIRKNAIDFRNKCRVIIVKS